MKRLSKSASLKTPQPQLRQQLLPVSRKPLLNQFRPTVSPASQQPPPEKEALSYPGLIAPNGRILYNFKDEK